VLGLLRPRTFRFRLIASMTALSLAALGVAGVLIHLRVERALFANLDDALVSIARTEIASAFDEPGKPVHVHEEDRPGSLTLAVGSGYEKFARITNGAGEVIAQTTNLAAHPLPDDAVGRTAGAAGEIAFADLRGAGGTFRGVYYPIRDAADPGTVALVAVSKEPVARALHAVTGALVVSLAAAALAAGWLGGRIARRLTHPLERVADAARAIGTNGTHTAIPEVSDDAELRVLTDILNGMLGRLDAALQAERTTAESQRRFVADASHELRTPLTNLRGTIEVALRHPRTAEEYRETLRTAVHEIERLTRLANDLLTLSRADAGRLPCEPSPCDLAAVASQAVHAWSDRAREQHVTIRLESAASVPIVADAGRIRQVFDNLLDNALRHAPPESEILVSAGALNGTATLAVRDRGPGLAPQDQARVFERFYRTDAARARHSGGLGLGLPIAKAIVEAHGGTLAVSSAPGEGCTFEARLPSTART
jgi:two-component system OmpR family sensor kinase